jgi:flavin-binding protein dodecin
MSSSVYKVIEIIGSSTKSWEDAAISAIATASKSLKDLRIAEVIEQDMQIEEGKIVAYRVKLHVSFKYLGKE